MPPSFPRSPRSDFLNWCLAHQDPWTTNATALSLTNAQITNYKTLVADAQAAWEAQVKAENARLAATEAADQVFTDLLRTTSDLVRRIKNQAGNTDNPNLYVLAEIPAPQPPGTAPAPAQPRDLTVSITPTGGLMLKWKASNPVGTQGTSYIIRRKLPGQSAFQFIGVSGKKTYTDNAMPAGPDSVQYTIQGQRADRAGPESQVFTVTFGVGGSGQSTASIQQAPKLAA